MVKINKRLLVKGFLWELLGILTLYIIFKNLELSILYILIRLIMYYIYHVIWKRFKWLK